MARRRRNVIQTVTEEKRSKFVESVRAAIFLIGDAAKSDISRRQTSLFHLYYIVVSIATTVFLSNDIQQEVIKTLFEDFIKEAARIVNAYETRE